MLLFTNTTIKCNPYQAKFRLIWHQYTKVNSEQKSWKQLNTLQPSFEAIFLPASFNFFKEVNSWPELDFHFSFSIPLNPVCAGALNGFKVPPWVEFASPSLDCSMCTCCLCRAFSCCFFKASSLLALISAGVLCVVCGSVVGGASGLFVADGAASTCLCSFVFYQEDF